MGNGAMSGSEYRLAMGDARAFRASRSRAAAAPAQPAKANPMVALIGEYLDSERLARQNRIDAMAATIASNLRAMDSQGGASASADPTNSTQGIPPMSKVDLSLLTSSQKLLLGLKQDREDAEKAAALKRSQAAAGKLTPAQIAAMTSNQKIQYGIEHDPLPLGMVGAPADMPASAPPSPRPSPMEINDRRLAELEKELGPIRR